jgi:hypothetical protein
MTTPIWPIEGVSLGSPISGSLGDRVASVYASINTLVQVYPTLAVGAEVVSANTDWVLGAFSEIVPVNTIASDFHIHGINIEACDKDAVFELVLYAGAGDEEVARTRFAIVGGFFGNIIGLIVGEKIDANSRIRAKLASSDGTANVATISISIRYALHS